MSAATADREHARSVELGMEAQATLGKLAVLKEEDALIASLAADMHELTGLLDSRQMPPGEIAWSRLLCWLRGHAPLRLNGTFYVVCSRCDATLNLRVSTWQAS